MQDVYYIKNLEPNKEDKLVYPYKSFNTSFRKTWLEKYSGIKIFRDGFRVRPYGENGNDWLNLGERQAQSPAGAGQRKGGFRIRPNQISGTIHISRLKNKSFEDKSGREGLQENESFKLFKNILLELIKIFEKDRNIIMYNLSQLQKNKEEEIKKIAREEAEKIEKEQELRERKEQKSQQDNQSNNADNDKQNNRDEIFAKATVTYEKELRDKNEEIRILRSLASVGLTVSSFAHEVKNLRARLVPRNDHLKSQLSKFLKQEDLINIRKEENPFYMIDLNYQEDLKLKHWLDYSLNSIKKDKRKRVNINIHTYFDSFEVTWKKALEKRQINLEILGKYDKTYVIQGFEVDLDVIFNNLLSNAINAFKEIKGKVTKKIIINWVKKEKNIEILFSDNGIGLSDEYKESPYDIFNLFETSKRDNHGNAIGTGLGLYLLKMIIAEYKNANFELVNNNDNLGFCVKISIPSI